MEKGDWKGEKRLDRFGKQGGTKDKREDRGREGREKKKKKKKKRKRKEGRARAAALPGDSRGLFRQALQPATIIKSLNALH